MRQSLNSLVSLALRKLFFLILPFPELERLAICFNLQAMGNLIYIYFISYMPEMGLQYLKNEIVIVINTFSWA